MKTRLFNIAIILCLSLTYCCKTKPQQTATVQPVISENKAKKDSLVVTEPAKSLTKNQPQIQQNYRLVVSFISIGSGINRPALEKLRTYFQTTDLLKMRNPEIEETHWGREGEVDFCMKLSAFKPAEQEKIVTSIRNLLKNENHIFIEENSICRHKRSR